MSSYSDLKKNSAFEGENAAYLEDLYEQYLQNPSSVSEAWQDYFQTQFQKTAHAPLHSKVRQRFLDLAAQKSLVPIVTPAARDACDQQLKVSHLIEAYRQFGHLQAKTDPLQLTPPSNLDILNLASWGLNKNDSNHYDADNLAGLKSASLAKIVETCEKIYCGSIGFEFEYIDRPAEVQWLRKKIETFVSWQLPQDQKINLLKELTAAEGLEKTLGARYVGVTRFSAEGGETQIPMLNALIHQSAALGIQEVMIGMAHRGRLNVLVNVLGMPPKDIFGQFEGNYAYQENRSDDVKYHYGYGANLKTAYAPIHASASFNPSHLEIVSPVVQGAVRARQDKLNDDQRTKVLAIQLHGDSAFAGQGVVMETFSLSQTRGFKVGGSIHLVINNQVGFTTSNPQDMRSSYYCTDIAKMVNAPIFHVNGDDPEAAIFVAQLALAYHAEFHKDVVIDLVCYRRYGHNEGDEPSATQPLMYQVIRKLPTTRKIYAEALVAQAVLTQAEVDSMINEYRDQIEAGKEIVPHLANPAFEASIPDWKKYQPTAWDTPTQTTISAKTLKEIAKKITQLPEGFKLQAQVAKIFAARADAYEGKTPLIWGDAEMLAYASLLNEGHRVRLVGQDSGRGTFAHRHAVLYDQTTGKAFYPLDQVSRKDAPFSVIDSVLSENAVMAFEYGYANMLPEALVLWEAQYGDFSNGAQVVIDQFLSSGEQKWGQYCGLVLLLPHGFEGMGPEHSSARLERFLQLCAQDNMQVCLPTSPAQLFHLLRRQVLRPYRKPLVIMTPKALLRKMTSTVEELTQGSFQVVIPDVEKIKADSVRRVILCSGMVYYHLAQKRQEKNISDIAIVRVEQLYPFPQAALKVELAKYKNAKSIVWCQEEHKNQGAWRQIRAELEACLPSSQVLTYVGRKPAASTAAGYKKLHEKELVEFLEEAMKA